MTAAGGPSPEIRRPVVGIPVLSVSGHAADTAAGDALYAAAVTRAGGIPVLLPTQGDRVTARDLAGRLDGLLLTGGRPLHQWSWAEHPRPTLEETDPDRYWFEHALILAAVERAIPVMGICRGMQMLNEALGGTLVRNLALDWPGALKHRQSEPAGAPTHAIGIAPDSRLAAVVGGAAARVNSHHLQAVDAPGAGLKAVAWADDGVIEAVEAPSDDAFLVGVQFHPEALLAHDERWLGLFAALVSAARRDHP